MRIQRQLRPYIRASARSRFEFVHPFFRTGRESLAAEGILVRLYHGEANSSRSQSLLRRLIARLRSR